MKNRTEIIGIGFMDRAKQLLRTYSGALEFTGNVLLGFLASNAYLFKNVAPFGVALVSASRQQNLPATAAGALAGYVLSFGPSANMKYIGAVIIAAALRWTLALLGERFALLIRSLCAFASVAITSLTVSAIGGLNIYNMVLACSEAALAAGAAYFFQRGEQALRRQEKTGLEIADLCCVIISFAVLLLSLTGVKIWQISLGRTVAVFLILFFSAYAGQMYSVVVGVTAGAVMGLGGSEYSFLMGSYGFGGLISGIFAPLGKLGVASSFIIVNGVAVLFSAQNSAVYYTLYEVFVATAVFMLIPSEWGDSLKTLSTPRTRPDGESIKDILLTKMSFARSALKDIADTTQKVSDKLTAMSAKDVGSICHQISQETCQRCGLNSFCWQSAYNDTMNTFQEIHTAYRAKGKVEKEDFPAHFVQRCCRLGQLIENANRAFEEMALREGTQHQVAQVRSVVTDQFEGMSTMLGDMAQEIDAITQADHRFGLRITELLQKMTIQPQSVVCYRDKLERLIVEVTVPSYKRERIDEAELTLDLSDICRCDLEKPVVTVAEKSIRYRFVEQANLTVAYACTQLNAKEGKVCGDTPQFFVDQNSNAVLILSDGMGSGPRAAVDSVMASGLLSRLIMAGIGFEAALKIVNSALLIKSGEESIATLDVSSIDLYTGKVQFLKAGAAPTYVKKSGRVGRVESTSLPIGILKGVSFESTSVTLSEGDALVMVSDGVTMTGGDWLSSEIASFQADSPKTLADHLAQVAKERFIDGHEDDITVMVAMLKKGV